ncbi:MAG: hypothetical protein AAF667_08210 [Pseudomonadota bacterium]
MSFIRPEAQHVLWRWREVLIGIALTIAGLWLGWKGIGAQALIGTLMMVGGVAFSFAGWQRVRFRTGRDGEGMVQVTEGRVTYFAPFLGGSIDAGDMNALTLQQGPRPLWLLSAPGREDLIIPTNAAGAEALFDFFTALPGFDAEAMLAALNAPGREAIVLWQRGHVRISEY